LPGFQFLAEDAQGYSRFNSSEEPRFLQIVRWAFKNPEKIAAIGFGVAAFGLAALLLGNYKEDRLEKTPVPGDQPHLK
jgi:hypothetical protein